MALRRLEHLVGNLADRLLVNQFVIAIPYGLL